MMSKCYSRPRSRGPIDENNDNYCKQKLECLPPRNCRETYFCGGIYRRRRFSLRRKCIRSVMSVNLICQNRNRNRNRKLQTSKAPLKSQAQGTSLFTSAASNQRGFPKNSPWEAQVRFPEGERM